MRVAADYALLTVKRRRLTVAKLPDGTQTLDLDEARRRWQEPIKPNSQTESDDARPTGERALAVAVGQLRAMRSPPVAGLATPSRIAYAEALVGLGLLEQDDFQVMTAGDGIADDTWHLLLAVSAAVGMSTDPVKLLDDEPARIAAYQGGCRVRPVHGGDEIVFLDGSSSVVLARTSSAAAVARCAELGAEEASRQIVAYALREGPPVIRSEDAAIREGMSSEQIRCWMVALLAAAPSTPFTWNPLEHTEAQVPYEGIISVLNALADAGWTVRHVSEDRGVNDDANASYVSEVRYLLSRD